MRAGPRHIHRVTVVGGKFLIDVPSGAGALSALSVVVESKCRLFRILQHISLQFAPCEISRFGVGHRNVRFLAIVSHCPFELGASLKHVPRPFTFPHTIGNKGGELLTAFEHAACFLQLIRTETTEVKLLQRGAVTEHLLHVFHTSRVETRQIERFQCAASGKHRLRISYFFRVETRNVEGLQRLASPEHPRHRFYLFGIEVLEVERLQRFTSVEHRKHRFHLPGVEALEMNCFQCAAHIKHFVYFLHILGIEGLEIKRFQRFAIPKHEAHVFHLFRVEIFPTFKSG